MTTSGSRRLGATIVVILLIASSLAMAQISRQFEVHEPIENGYVTQDLEVVISNNFYDRLETNVVMVNARKLNGTNMGYRYNGVLYPEPPESHGGWMDKGLRLSGSIRQSGAIVGEFSNVLVTRNGGILWKTEVGKNVDPQSFMVANLVIDIYDKFADGQIERHLEAQ